MNNSIQVRGARTHNLKNLSVDVPKEGLVVFTGPSGAGKSSLLFDTIHTEAQRQLVETFSTFARRRLPKLTRPPVDEIRNLGVSILVDQKPMGRTLRSTVGTATEISDYLRMLYSRFGSPFVGPSFFFSFNNPEGMCPECSGLGKRIRIDPAVFYDPGKSLREGALLHPDYKAGSYSWREYLSIDLFDPDLPLGEWKAADLERFLYTEPIPVEVRHGAGSTKKKFEGVIRRLERYYANKADDEADEGAKNAYDRFLRYLTCPACRGARLNPRALSVRVGGKTIAEACALELTEFDAFLAGLGIPHAEGLVSKMRSVAGSLISMGAGYLSLDRSVSTLSGGESQRVKLARRLDCDLSGLVYVLDEPSSGLHPADARALVPALRSLSDAGNAILMVEHDPALIAQADWAIEIGPRAGREGGKLLYSGTVEGLSRTEGPTGRVLRDRRAGTSANRERRPWTESFAIREARANNLKGVCVDIPKGILVGVCGPAGSGKSSLIHEELVPSHPEAVVMGQAPIGRTSRGTVASYIGAFDIMRREFARATGAQAGLFSFNSKGACPKCSGAGFLSVDMNFLDDVRMVCDECEGVRYRPEVLALQWRGKSIADALAMTAEEAGDFFRESELKRRLAVLADVGLDYLPLGQSLSSLSGGESQRLKLASELHRAGGIYVLDEPTGGLHPTDVARLVSVLERLARGGNSVIVIEHDLDTLAACSWLIELGPAGGLAGGRVIAQGTPEDLAADPASVTGPFLREVL